MNVTEITQGITLAFSSCLEAHGVYASQWAKDISDLAVRCPHPSHAPHYPSSALRRVANQKARELWCAITDLGLECLWEWADEMRRQAEDNSRKYPSARAHRSHLILERFVKGLEPDGLDQYMLDRSHSRTNHFALELFGTNETGERPVQTLVDTIHARAERRAFSTHPKDVFHHRVCPLDRQARIANMMAGKPAPNAQDLI